MKILIIEDSDYKVQSLLAYLQKTTIQCDMQIARSYQSGKRLLKEFQPQLVLLDMTLPTSERADGQLEGRTRIFGGRDILAEMEFLNLMCKVIIITQFDSFGEPPDTIDAKSLFLQLNTKYPRHFMGGVYYSNIDSSWQIQLKQFLKKLEIKLV